MLFKHELLKIENVLYKNNTFHFLSSIENNIINDFIIRYNKNLNQNIENYTYQNVLVINNLHYCYSHMIIDEIFAYYWALKEIGIDKIKLLVRTNTNSHIHDKKCLQNIVNNKFKNEPWNNMISLITNDDILFENIFNGSINIKNCYFYKIKNNDQRSIWNTRHVYPGRKIEIPLYKDDIIYKMMDMYINDIFKHNKINRVSLLDKKKVIIIDRNDNRRWDNDKLNNIINRIKKVNVEYNGIYILDKMTLNDQIKLFTSNNIFIFRHGSCLTNMAWIPKNSLIFDIDVKMNRNLITQRLADCTDSKVIRLNYNNINYDTMVNEISNIKK